MWHVHAHLRRVTSFAGPRSSAVVGGYTHLHSELEACLAELKGTEDCLLFPTGFAANLAVLTALCSDAAAAIFSDEYNHASIIDGARLAARNKVGPLWRRMRPCLCHQSSLSVTAHQREWPVLQGQLHIYRHNDLQHLEALLQSCPAQMRKLVVTDSLFSMDGEAVSSIRVGCVAACTSTRAL